MNTDTGKEDNTLYAGRRYPDGTVVVTRNGLTLDPASPPWSGRQPARDYEWGHLGAEPAHLSLALLADALGERRILAAVFYRRFMRDVVQNLRLEWWLLTRARILQWVAEQPDYLGLAEQLAAEGGAT